MARREGNGHKVCFCSFLDPEAPFSWSQEEISDLYDHTTILFAAEGKKISPSPYTSFVVA